MNKKINTSDRKSAGLILLNNILPDVTKTAFRKRGITEVKMINDWQLIVGPELAKHCSPDRIIYAKKGSGKGATLYINVYGGIALELQHMEPLIVERISSYFGYNAVAKIKLMQTKRKEPKEKSHDKKITNYVLDQREVNNLESKIDEINDPSLKAALAELGRNVLARAIKTDGDLS